MAAMRRRYSIHAAAHQARYGLRYRRYRPRQSTASASVTAACSMAADSSSVREETAGSIGRKKWFAAARRNERRALAAAIDPSTPPRSAGTVGHR